MTFAPVFAAAPDEAAKAPALEATASEDRADRTLRMGGRAVGRNGSVDYEAVAEMVTLPTEGGGPKAEVFFVSTARPARAHLAARSPSPSMAATALLRHTFISALSAPDGGF